MDVKGVVNLNSLKTNKPVCFNIAWQTILMNDFVLETQFHSLEDFEK